MPWSAPFMRSEAPEPAEWSVTVDSGSRAATEWFDAVGDAIAWARARAELVLVRLGDTEDTMYSAGRQRANQLVDGSGADYPEWPPDNWPDYKGPAHETRRLSERDLNRW
jgi:hypothetical protein